MTVASDMILGDAEVGLAAGAESMSQVREKGDKGGKGGEGKGREEMGRSETREETGRRETREERVELVR